jgi:cytochrome c553
MERRCGSLLLVIGLSLMGPTAMAQDARGTEIIERALQSKPDIDAGKRIYREQCANCHGANGFGNAEEVIPALAGQLPIYVIKQLVDMSEGDRESASMHRIAARKALTTPQALSDVARYLGGLNPNPRPETGDGARLALGKRYYQGLCAYCHGAQGGGNEAHATPALRRQHYSYLLMQMRELSAGHRYSVDDEVLDMLQRLPYDQLTAVADYVSRLPSVDESPVNSERAPAKQPH